MRNNMIDPKYPLNSLRFLPGKPGGFNNSRVPDLRPGFHTHCPDSTSEHFHVISSEPSHTISLFLWETALLESGAQISGL